ncbi:MAG: hypothetical protein ACR2G6_12145 [Gemmatimonadaceae bacterium]
MIAISERRSPAFGDAFLVQMGEMLRGLRARRVWDVLDAMASRALPLGEVFDVYRGDAQLTDLRASLDAIDLEPYVREWHEDQLSRGTQSADKYERQLRLLIPTGVKVFARHVHAASNLGAPGQSRCLRLNEEPPPCGAFRLRQVSG